MTKTIAKIRPAALAALLLAGTQAYAVGTGTIADGVGNISTSGRTTTVNQSSDKLIINWDNMNVGSTETLAFRQPGANASVLNRINSVDPTSIQGTLTSNGRVFIVNPNGVVFGSTARVNVGTLIASSLNISDENFKESWASSNGALYEEGVYFSGGGQGNIINNGRINATGSVGLIGAKTVENNGSINSDGGNIELAAGADSFIEFTGSRLLAAAGRSGSAGALVNNNGSLRTVDGNITLRAHALDSIARSVINNTGTIEAQSLTRIDGWGASAYGAVFISGERLDSNDQAKIGGSIDARRLNIEYLHTATIDGDIYAQHQSDFDNPGSVYIRVDNAKTTDHASIQTNNLWLIDGDFDFTQGSIATDNIQIDAKSADISLIGAFQDNTTAIYSLWSGGTKNDLRVRSAENLDVDSIKTGGNLELSSQGTITLRPGWSDYQLQSGGDMTITGKNFRADAQPDWFAYAPSIYTGGNLTIKAQDNIYAPGRITVFGDSTVLTAETGNIELGTLQTSLFGLDTSLRAGKNIVFNDLSSVWGNLSLESQGDVTFKRGIQVGGNLGYTLASSGKVFSGGPVQVRGTTTGLPTEGVQPLQ